jgi:mono/diheme cytochrome c family protein
LVRTGFELQRSWVKVNRSFLNLTIDLLAAASLMVMIATGYILRFPLPPTTNRTHELWGMSRHEWGTIHSWASLVLLVILGIHVALHWGWLFATIRSRFLKTKAAQGARFRAGALAVVALMTTGGLFAWAAQAGVRELETPLHPLRTSEVPATVPLDLAPTLQAVDFQKHVMPIFEASCIGCHGPKKQKGGFRVDLREDFFAPGDAAPLIVPGSQEKSRLIAIVSGEVKDMKSAEDHILPDHEITILKAWINAGADWPSK